MGLHHNRYSASNYTKEVKNLLK